MMALSSALNLVIPCVSKNDDIDKADFAQRFDADFVLMTGELSALIEKGYRSTWWVKPSNFITRYHSTKTAYLTL